MPRPKNIAQALTRSLLVGLGQIGGRAAASAAKSVMSDGRRIARQVEQRLDAAASRIDDMIGRREHDDE
jgi:hypothetical protein